MRLIDAEALKEAFEKVYPLATNELGGVVNKQIYDIIENAPTIKTFTLADIEEQYLKGLEKGLSKWEAERPKGEWIDEGLYAEGHSEHAYTCKNCGYQIIVKPNMIFEERFCKCCGAEMKNTDPIIKAIQENNAKYDERPNIDFSRISYDLGGDVE